MDEKRIIYRKVFLNMRRIPVDQITENIKEMCIEANLFLTEDMKKALHLAGIKIN